MENDRQKILTIFKSILANLCHYSIKCDYTFSIFVSVTNDIGSESIYIIWRDDIAIGGSVANLIIMFFFNTLYIAKLSPNGICFICI